MLSEELKAKIEITKDLLNKGATEIQFVGEDLKVTKNNFSALEKFFEKFPQLGNQLVSVNVDVSSNLNINFEVKLEGLKSELLGKETDLKKIAELNDHISALVKELKKPKPDKKKLTTILKWALEKGWEFFIKIAPIVLEKYG
ncbi:MAG: hypothetical protein IH950_14850 [Bacteroidetes bacterium]|nr:hypothetical protein [Bacteroidota bacterium]